MLICFSSRAAINKKDRDFYGGSSDSFIGPLVHLISKKNKVPIRVKRVYEPTAKITASAFCRQLFFAHCYIRGLAAGKWSTF